MRTRRAAPLLALLVACGPEREVFTSAYGATCASDLQCGDYALCLGDECVSCGRLYEVCDVMCPGGWSLSDDSRNGCPLCGCPLATGGASGAGGTSSIGGTEPEGTATGGTGVGGEGVGIGGATSGGGAGCLAHLDCPVGERCEQLLCWDCATTSPTCPACSSGEQAMLLPRNGCTVCDCVRPNLCLGDVDCPPGLTCYPGENCADGCRDPSCCFGNLCAEAGCAPPVGLSCGAFGCANGAPCALECFGATCSCDVGSGSFVCDLPCDPATSCSR